MGSHIRAAGLVVCSAAAILGFIVATVLGIAASQSSDNVAKGVPVTVQRPNCTSNNQVSWDCLYQYEARMQAVTNENSAVVEANHAKVQAWSETAVTVALVGVGFAICGVAFASSRRDPKPVGAPFATGAPPAAPGPPPTRHPFPSGDPR